MRSGGLDATVSGLLIDMEIAWRHGASSEVCDCAGQAIETNTAKLAIIRVEIFTGYPFVTGGEPCSKNRSRSTDDQEISSQGGFPLPHHNDGKKPADDKQSDC